LHTGQFEDAQGNRPAFACASFPAPAPALMKKIAICVAIVVFILFLTKIANQVPSPPPPGTAFALKAQNVIQCSADEITLVDHHQKATHLDKDASWPDCAAFNKDDTLDLYLSRGEKTHFLSYEKTVWWRKAM
jgi:hypothetical protein